MATSSNDGIECDGRSIPLSQRWRPSSTFPVIVRRPSPTVNDARRGCGANMVLFAALPMAEKAKLSRHLFPMPTMARRPRSYRALP
jgi:hypothetical protein